MYTHMHTHTYIGIINMKFRTRLHLRGAKMIMGKHIHYKTEFTSFSCVHETLKISGKLKNKYRQHSQTMKQYN